MSAGEKISNRDFKFKKRDLKLARKEREVVQLIEASKIQSQLKDMKPKLIAKLAGVSRQLVYRV